MNIDPNKLTENEEQRKARVSEFMKDVINNDYLDIIYIMDILGLWVKKKKSGDLIFPFHKGIARKLRKGEDESIYRARLGEEHS